MNTQAIEIAIPTTFSVNLFDIFSKSSSRLNEMIHVKRSTYFQKGEQIQTEFILSKYKYNFFPTHFDFLLQHTQNIDKEA